MINRRNILKFGASLPLAGAVPVTGIAALAGPQSASGVSPFLAGAGAVVERVAAKAFDGLPAPEAQLLEETLAIAPHPPTGESLASWRDGHVHGDGI